MIRKVIEQTKGYETSDGAGVSLVRVLGARTAKSYDPFIMLDAFDSTDRATWEAGFPMHPHRGIETVSFLSRGSMLHRDHLGTEALVTDGEAQWLTAGSGAFHEEWPDGEDRILGLQLWLNLPAKDKLTAPPAYYGISKKDIKEFPFEGGKLRLVTGEYKGESGHKGKYLPLDYYDIHLEAGAAIKFEVDEKRSAMIFTLVGDVEVAGEKVAEKTAAKLGEGTEVEITAGDKPVEVIFISSVRLDEPMEWYGPIVMNTKEELKEAYEELKAGTFIKNQVEM